jgi:hypothetical protein
MQTTWIRAMLLGLVVLVGTSYKADAAMTGSITNKAPCNETVQLGNPPQHYWVSGSASYQTDDASYYVQLVVESTGPNGRDGYSKASHTVGPNTQDNISASFQSLAPSGLGQHTTQVTLSSIRVSQPTNFLSVVIAADGCFYTVAQ